MAAFKKTLTLQTESGQVVSIDLRNALILAAAPTTSTEAREGMQAYVVSGGTITAEYVCTAVSGSTYTWVKREVSGGGSAEVTAESIKNALGYTPADEDEVSELSKAITNKANKAGWTPDKYIGTDAKGNLVEKDAPAGGGSETVTTEKIYAAAVKSLKQVGTNNYIPQKDSVLFVANADGVVNVGSDNLIDYTINNYPPNTTITEPLHIVTAIDKGYHFESNPNYTASTHFANSRFYLRANIVAGKTYTLSFQQSVKIYVYLVYDAENPSNSVLITTDSTTDLQSVTFTAEADYQAVRFAPSSLPADLTNVTLCEGEAPLPYGGASETYTVTAGQALYLTNVLKQNIVGNGVFYESPIAITSLNGQETTDGNMNTCTNNAVWVNMGDSIWTFGADTGGIGTITDYMKSLCGGTWHNIATGGTTMATRPGDYAGTYDALDFWKLADAIVAGDYTDAKAAAAELTSNFANIDNVDWSAVDYITIAYGTNDIAFGGTIDNADNLYDTATICGALRYGIKTISAKYPNIRFMVLAVLNRGADSVPLKTILECNKALKSAADYMGAEFVDGYGINEGNRGTFLYDGTHPNAAGKQRIAETVARHILAVDYVE